ncbi:KAT8 regulatory NSL complex subunit 3 isoform X3 [Drosophila serrata]|uniref:KAT8 regulatory NSL complex subunit 3 isoform X3 n=1 Tax=Drosophila serrata TaxID=7274 RepID=UPI000A1D3683|nr:KAT8 regulatory NSL complex subunit 3 isoform X3 [Drosophila serrata]
MMKQIVGKSGSKPQPTEAATAGASASIITYSPSKFLNRVGPGDNTYTTHSHTHTSASAAAAMATATTATSVKTAAANITTKTNKSPAGGGLTSYFVSSTISAPSESSFGEKMEHSYIRDPVIRNEVNNGLAPARNILVRHPPQCPSCHTYPQQEDPTEMQQVHVPPYDEIAAKEAMNECARIAKYVKNNNSDEQDWVARVNQFGWTPMQQLLFEKVCSILDQDQLARLANDKRQHEAIHRRVSVDKSASRLRKALAGVSWEPRITQWLHTLLMEHLSASYMASYLDILQTLKTKLPTLVDKMLFSRPLNNSQELLAPVMKKRWEPNILPKGRQLSHNAIIVVLPTMPTSGVVTERMQKWYQALATITQVVQITLPNSNNRMANQNLDQVAETIVSLTRVRIHELRTDNPNRGIILVGFNAGASLVLQVALSESVACVVCMGFAYNTIRGPRGLPDDRMLDIKAPILFVIGQNSARTSQEEMEGLRERMQSESSLVVVGSADDALRVPKSKRRIEGVTQAMVDYMVVEEIFDFVSRTLNNPPGPRMPTSLMHQPGYQRQLKQLTHVLADGNANKAVQQMRKRKLNDGQEDFVGQSVKTKIVSASRPHKPKPPRLIDPFAVKRKGKVFRRRESLLKPSVAIHSTNRFTPIPTPLVGRPRTRPLAKVGGSAVSISGQKDAPHQDKSNLSSEELNQSIEFILDDTEGGEDAAAGAGPGSSGAFLPKVIKPGGVLSKQLPPVNLAVGTKIKMIPSSQFVQIKSLGPQGKLINYKPTSGPTSTSAGNIVKSLPGPSSAGGQQIFTVKTSTGQTTQFTTAGPSSSSTSTSSSTVGQQKYTVFKNANGMTMLQLTKPATSSSSGNVDLSNIIDMPIVFADNEGNIADQQQQQQQLQQLDKDIKPAPIRNTNKAPLIISQKIIKEANKPPGIVNSSGTTASKPGGANIVLNKGMHQLFTTTPPSPSGTPVPGQNKVLYINRNTMKPMGSMVATGAHRVPIRILSNPKTGAVTTSSPLVVDPATGSLVPGVKAVNVHTIKPTAATIRQVTTTKAYSQFQVINSSTPGTPTAVSGDGKSSIRNVYFKSAAGLKQVPVQMLANRLAPSSPAIQHGGAAGMRRVVNIGTVSKLAAGPTGPDSKVIKLQPTTGAITATKVEATTTASPMQSKK